MPLRNISNKLLRGETLSNSSSRSASRTRTPAPDGEENGSLDVNFQNIDELLRTKLESLQTFIDSLAEDNSSNEPEPLLNANSQDYKQKSVDQMNKLRIQSRSTSIVDIIYSLGLPRSEVSSSSREMMLAQLYNLIISKPLLVFNEENIGTERYVTEDRISDLMKIFMTGDYRSSSEFLFLFRSILALIGSDIDEYGGLVSSEFMSYVQQLIHEPATTLITNENKASLITGYASILLILHNGSSSFGIDEKINWLVEVSEGFAASSIALTQEIESGDREHSTVFDENDDKKIISDYLNKANAEAAVAIGGLHAVGCLLTLLDRGDYLNECVSDLMPKLVTILDNDDTIEISKAAARVIALCYEVYTYDNSEEEEEEEEYNYNSPYYEQESLFTIVERLANLSSKKLSKKDKKQTHSIFRDVLSTLQNYTDKESRIEIYKKSPKGMELINSAMDSTYIKLSKTRSLPINSWYLYLRLIHLKWCFSFGVHNQLISNDTIKDVLKEPPTEFQLRYGNENSGLEFDGNSSYADWSSKFAVDDKTRTENIRKARMNKLADELYDLDIEHK